MVNRVILIGNLGSDPEIKTLESGRKVAKVSIATNENYRDKDGEWQTQTEWHDLVLWGALAERAESDLKKGDALYLEGKLTHRKWVDAENNNRKTTEVVVNYFRQINRSSGGSTSGYFPDEQHIEPYDQAEQSKRAKSPATTATSKKGDAGEDLPF